MSTSQSQRTLFLVRFSIILALEVIVCFTPLGSLPLGFGIVATLMCVPVIVAAIVLGPGAGTVMGFISGLFSFLVWTFAPPGLGGFVFTPFYSVGEVSGNFWSLVICFVPRTLVGTVSGFVFKALDGRKGLSNRKGKGFAYGLSGLLGSMTNTIGVLGGIYIFFGRAYAAEFGIGYEALLGVLGSTIAVNGVLEAVACTVIAAAVCQPLKLVVGRRMGA